MNIDFKKLSPTHTKDWYVEWVASIVLIVAQALTSAGDLAPYNLILFAIGLSGWLLVGYWWHDRALIVINSVGIFINITGILKFYMSGVQYMMFEFFYYTFIAMVIILAWMTYDDVRMEKRNNGQYAFVTSILDNQ